MLVGTRGGEGERLTEFDRDKRSIGQEPDETGKTIRHGAQTIGTDPQIDLAARTSFTGAEEQHALTHTYEKQQQAVK